LSRDGCLLGSRLILGVRPLDAAHRGAAARAAAGAGAASLRAAPPSAPARPARVGAASGDGLPRGGGGGAWSRVAHFVFGA